MKTDIKIFILSTVIAISSFTASKQFSDNNTKFASTGNVYDSIFDSSDIPVPDDSEYNFTKDNVTGSQDVINIDNISESFPESYDLRDFGIVSPVRSQGSYGTCWAISALGSIETQIMRNGWETMPALSSWHLSYFSYAGNRPFTTSNETPFLTGGNNTTAISTLSKWVGPVSETSVPYAASNYVNDDMQHEYDYQVQDVYNVHPWIESHMRYSKNSIKELIMQHNAVSVYYNASDAYYNPKTFAHNCYNSTEVTHGINIIGWDDNFSRENFTEVPEHNGAWLVKNSWGKGWGDNGYLWISYDDTSLHEAVCYFCKPKDTYGYNYYYDDHGWITSISTNAAQTNLTGYMANVFTAHDDEEISAVSFYTIDPGASYDIQVYKGLLKRSPLGTEVSSTTSGSEEYKGYHTVDLDEPVSVSAGERFSVVVKITNPSSPYTIPVEAAIYTTIDNVNYANISMSALSQDAYVSKSFVSNDGISWFDPVNKTYTYKYPDLFNLKSSTQVFNYVFIGNVCLKAFSKGTYCEPDPVGDINGDGNVNAVDAVILIRYLNSEDISEEVLSYDACDVNSDGVINLLDIIYLKSILIK